MPARLVLSHLVLQLGATFKRLQNVERVCNNAAILICRNASDFCSADTTDAPWVLVV
jgi:hypothetical protein